MYRRRILIGLAGHGLFFYHQIRLCFQGGDFSVDSLQRICFSTLDEYYPEATESAFSVIFAEQETLGNSSPRDEGGEAI